MSETIWQAGSVLSSHRDSIEVTTMMGSWENDPEWRFVDANAHEHAWGWGSFAWIVNPDYIDPDDYEDDDDWWEEYDEYEGGEFPSVDADPGWYACVTCGERITPGRRYKTPPAHREFVSGMATYMIKYPNGVTRELTPEEYRTCIDEMRNARRLAA